MNVEMFEEIPNKPVVFKKGLDRIKKAFNLNWKNAIKHPIESIKWIIAVYLDENPKYCWAKLVIWVQFESFWEIFELDNFLVTCNPKDTYCGKCENGEQRE